MKRKTTLFYLLTFVALFTSSPACTAQGGLGSDLKLGVQLSPTFSGMSTDNNLINGDGSNLGVKLGLIAEFYFQENYSIHTGIGFHFNAGGTLNYDEQFERVDIWRESLDETFPVGSIPDSVAGGLSYKYDINLLEIPLGLTLRTREFGYLRYWARPQLNLGIVTGSNGSIENAGFVDSDEDFDIGDEVNGLNLGWGIGAGVEYAISTSSALIGGIGYQSGFTDLTRDKGTTVRRQGRNASEDDSKGRLSSFVITLGLIF